MKVTLEMPDDTRIITITVARFTFPNMQIAGYNISTNSVSDGCSISLKAPEEVSK